MGHFSFHSSVGKHTSKEKSVVKSGLRPLATQLYMCLSITYEGQGAAQGEHGTVERVGDLEWGI